MTKKKEITLIKSSRIFDSKGDVSIENGALLIEDDQIGNIVLGTFNLMSHGMEHWHPNPDFFFKKGAGPVFDVGIYYITQLINLLGPVKSVNALNTSPEKERTITRNG